MLEKTKASGNNLEMPLLETGMRLEVVTNDNKLVFVGRIESVENHAIRVADVTGADVPYIEYNSPIKLRGFYHAKAIFLEGMIGGSTNKFWKIDRLHTLQISEQRSYFRQNIVRDVNVMCINELYGMPRPENETDHPISCRLMNISATGLLISMKKDLYQEGDWLRLTDLVLQPNEKPFSLTCAVRRRVILDDSVYGYGCEIYELDRREQERLIHGILLLQRQERQARQKEME